MQCKLFVACSVIEGKELHKEFSSFLVEQGEPVDESSVKKMILTFEKRSYKNQELRIKFPDSAEKWV